MMRDFKAAIWAAASLALASVGCGGTAEMCLDADPVCGSDGVTYPSTCDARRAGVAYVPGGCGVAGSGGSAGGGSGTTGVGGSVNPTGGTGGVGGTVSPTGGTGGTVSPTGGTGGTVSPTGGTGGTVNPTGGTGGSGNATGGAAGSAGGGSGVERLCGGIAGLACGRGEACIFPSGTCRLPDAAGTCRPLNPPIACTADVRPVCGCDGKTYSNACQAEVASVSVLHDGACKPACVAGSVDPECGGGSRLCGGIAGLPCAKGEYCAYASGQCRLPDAAGVCRPNVEVVCTHQYDPVCGCDGRTYGNDCAALVAGVSVLHAGTCEQSCTVGSATYPNGTSGIPAEDGCNTCSCFDGQLACTRRACNVNACVIDGKIYPDGTGGMPDPESCNTCSCSGGAVGACTKVYCPLPGKSCRVGRAIYRHGSESVTLDGSVRCVCNDGAFDCAAVQ